MPRALAPCRQPGCPQLVAGGGGCEAHAREPFRSPTWSPLPSNWTTLRARVLRRDRQRCVECGRPATSVDHLIARAHGGGDAMANLRSLCSIHARLKDAADSR